MHDSTKLALGIALLWLAGMAFFVAFHPGGVVMPDGSAAKNPSDIIKYTMQQAKSGKVGGKSGGTDTGSTPGA